MAATTPATILFGAAGATDPVMFHPGLVCIKRKFDFGATPLDISEDGADQALFGIPKSFVAIGAFFESCADKAGKFPSASGTVTLKVADTTAGDDIPIASTFTPSASAYKRQTILNGAAVGSAGITQDGTSKVVSAIAVPSAMVAFDSVDSTTGKLLAFATFGADQTQGAITVGIIGFVPDGDSLENVVTPSYRDAGQTATNAAGIDPYQGNSIRRG